jgi:hypothetical protein
MKYENITPPDYVERKFCEQIHICLQDRISDDVLLTVRGWEQAPTFPQQKYISIVTSAEGHQYVPIERDDPNCLGVFMHYYPKPSVEAQYNPESFLKLDNVYPLPLGETKFFEGNNLTPILQRPIDVAFIGQFDPYRRVDFHSAVIECSKKIDNSVFHFYEGWNNGVGAKYSEIMSNTKIALVPCGSASLDTFRFYEAARCGCIIISCPQNHYEFMTGSPHIETTRWEGLDLGIRLLLKEQKLFPKVSLGTRLFWEQNLSPAGTANYIYNKVKEKLC